MSRRERPYACRCFPPQPRFRARFRFIGCMRRNTVTSPRTPCACSTLAAEAVLYRTRFHLTRGINYLISPATSGLVHTRQLGHAGAELLDELSRFRCGDDHALGLVRRLRAPRGCCRVIAAGSETENLRHVHQHVALQLDEVRRLHEFDRLAGETLRGLELAASREDLCLGASPPCLCLDVVARPYLSAEGREPLRFVVLALDVESLLCELGCSRRKKAPFADLREDLAAFAPLLLGHGRVAGNHLDLGRDTLAASEGHRETQFAGHRLASRRNVARPREIPSIRLHQRDLEQQLRFGEEVALGLVNHFVGSREHFVHGCWPGAERQQESPAETGDPTPVIRALGVDESPLESGSALREAACHRSHLAAELPRPAEAEVVSKVAENPDCFRRHAGDALDDAFGI